MFLRGSYGSVRTPSNAAIHHLTDLLEAPSMTGHLRTSVNQILFAFFRQVIIYYSPWLVLLPRKHDWRAHAAKESHNPRDVTRYLNSDRSLLVSSCLNRYPYWPITASGDESLLFLFNNVAKTSNVKDNVLVVLVRKEELGALCQLRGALTQHRVTVFTSAVPPCPLHLFHFNSSTMNEQNNDSNSHLDSKFSSPHLRVASGGTALHNLQIIPPSKSAHTSFNSDTSKA
jgi:hypothetical protein